MKRFAPALMLIAVVLIFAFASQASVGADGLITTNLAPGWNLFAHLRPSQVLPQALAQVDGKYSAVWSLDGTSQGWRGFDPDAPAILNRLKVLKRFGAYLINMKEAGVLAQDPTAAPLLANPFLPAERVSVLPGPESPKGEGVAGKPTPAPIPPPVRPPLVRIVGEVRNLSDANVTNVQIVALAQDAAGNVTAAIPFGRVLRFIIPVGEVSPFEIIGLAPGEPRARFVVVAAGDPTREGPLPLTLLNVILQRSPLIPEVACLSGEVRNDGTTAVGFIRIVGSLSNAAGDIISVFETFVGDFGRFGPSALEPGETRPFETCLNAPPQDIASFKLWAEGGPFFGPKGPEAASDGAPLREAKLAAGTLTTNLFLGWNLFTYLGPSQPLPQALAQIEGKYTVVTSLSGASGAFDSFDPRAPSAVSRLDSLQQFGAYFIHMREAGSLTFPVAAPPPLTNPKLPTERTSVFAPREPFFFPPGGAVIVGEVRNRSDTNVQFPQVVAFLRDGVGDLVDIAPSGFALRQIIPMGDASPFQLFFQLKAAHASFDLVAVGQPTEESPPTGLTLLNVKGPSEQFPGGPVCVTGQVRNDSDRPFGFVQVVGSFYNAAGNVIRVVEGGVFPGEPPFPKEVSGGEEPAPTPAPPIPPQPPLLEPGAVAPFQACAFPPVPVREVANFKLWAEGHPFIGPPPLPPK